MQHQRFGTKRGGALQVHGKELHAKLEGIGLHRIGEVDDVGRMNDYLANTDLSCTL